jgi:hypothetical protein
MWHTPCVGRFRTCDHSSCAAEPIDLAAIIIERSAHASMPCYKILIAPPSVQADHASKLELASTEEKCVTVELEVMVQGPDCVAAAGARRAGTAGTAGGCVAGTVFTPAGIGL